MAVVATAAASSTATGRRLAITRKRSPMSADTRTETAIPAATTASKAKKNVMVLAVEYDMEPKCILRLPAKRGVRPTLRVHPKAERWIERAETAPLGGDHVGTAGACAVSATAALVGAVGSPVEALLSALS